jgi:predicted AlkP superfamily phosphohydrolase/phosphomutase
VRRKPLPESSENGVELELIWDLTVAKSRLQILAASLPLFAPDNQQKRHLSGSLLPRGPFEKSRQLKKPGNLEAKGNGECLPAP